jgi:hypothetical protein
MPYVKLPFMDANYHVSVSFHVSLMYSLIYLNPSRSLPLINVLLSKFLMFVDFKTSFSSTLATNKIMPHAHFWSLDLSCSETFSTVYRTIFCVAYFQLFMLIFPFQWLMICYHVSFCCTIDLSDSELNFIVDLTFQRAVRLELYFSPFIPLYNCSKHCHVSSSWMLIRPKAFFSVRFCRKRVN